MPKKKLVPPLYIKDNKGKTTHVFLNLETYKTLLKEAQDFEKLQEKKGIKWVNIIDRKRDDI